MASEIRVNKITNRSGLSTATWNGDGIDVAGIATAHNFKTGTTNVHSTGIELANVNTGGATATFGGPLVGSTGSFSGNVTISGNLGVAGTVTYEDVSRVDATGISTFREGFKLGPLAGIALTAYKDGSIRSTGIITATKFIGDGSELTGAGPTLANGSNDRIVTSTGANALTGETNLTYSSSFLLKNTTASASNNTELVRLENTHSDGKLTVMGFRTNGLTGPQTKIFGGNDNSGVGSQAGNSGAGKFKVTITNPSGTDQEVIYAENDANSASKFIRFSTDGNERLRIQSDGTVQIGTQSNHTKWVEFADSTRDDATEIRVNNGSNSDFEVVNNRSGGKIKLYTNSSSRFEIDGDGYITNPGKRAAAFCARCSSTFNVSQNGIVKYNTTSAGSNDYQAFDIGSNYSTSTGKFTCPVDGVYYFEAQAMTTGWANGNSMQDLLIMKSNRGTVSNPRQRRSWFRSDADNNGYYTNSVSGLYNGSAGDTVWIIVAHACGISNLSYSYFSGYLVA